MGLLILIAIVTFFFLFIDLTRAAAPRLNQAILVKTCPPHKWEYGQDGGMFCTTCRNKPFQGGLQ